MNKKIVLLIALLSFGNISHVLANQVEVTQVKIDCDKTCAFHVTLLHVDTGWEHYANAWEVLDSNGAVLAKRVLYHPHVNEQPFTRSLTGVTIPQDTQSVWIRANDSVHGYSELYKVDLK